MTVKYIVEILIEDGKGMYTWNDYIELRELYQMIHRVAGIRFDRFSKFKYYRNLQMKLEEAIHLCLPEPCNIMGEISHDYDEQEHLWKLMFKELLLNA